MWRWLVSRSKTVRPQSWSPHHFFARLGRLLKGPSYGDSPNPPILLDAIQAKYRRKRRIKLNKMLQQPSGQGSIPGLGLLDAAASSSNTQQEQQRQQQPAVPEKKEKKARKSKHALRKQQETEARAAAMTATEVHRAKPRSVPSEASGGVPTASREYLVASLPPSITLPAPRRILVVMDLNGTLLYRPNHKRPFHFVERPHASRFLRYCLDTFHVVIWSSARPDNVRTMVANLLSKKDLDRCLLVWARDQLGLCQSDYDARVQCYKRLDRVWNHPAVLRAHPDAANGGRWDQSNTVLVDDSAEKGRSEPYNILALPEFTGINNETAEVLPQVHDFINLLSWQSDISRYMREHPFKLDPNYALPR